MWGTKANFNKRKKFPINLTNKGNYYEYIFFFSFSLLFCLIFPCQYTNSFLILSFIAAQYFTRWNYIFYRLGHMRCFPDKLSQIMLWAIYSVWVVFHMYRQNCCLYSQNWGWIVCHAITKQAQLFCLQEKTSSDVSREMCLQTWIALSKKQSHAIIIIQI